MRVRKARAGDLRALVRLENDTFDYDRMSARQLRRHVANPRAILVVAECAGALVGSALVFLRADTKIARLYSIAIARAARGKGHGERLLATVERAAAERSATALRLEVRADNADAQRLYERRGYRRIGLRRRYYDDGHDALRYEKTLGAKRSAPTSRRRDAVALSRARS